MKTKQELIDKWESAIEAAEFYGRGKDETLIDYMKDFVSDLNQLDEPETLSQDWIDNHTDKFVSNGDLRFVSTKDLQNLLVPKQDVPVVPMWFDEWWKDVTKGGGNLFHNIERFYDELFSSGTRKTYYISDPDNEKKLLNIIVNELEYGVEEEQKYYVVDNAGRNLLYKHNGNVITELEATEFTAETTVTDQLTEQEIKDYDPRYWAFAKPVEEIEK